MNDATKARIYKIFQGLLISFLAGGAISVLIALGHTNFGVYTPFVVAITATLINALHVVTGGQDTGVPPSN